MAEDAQQTASDNTAVRPFHVLDLDRITAEVFADNTPSARLFAGVGFVREGVKREGVMRESIRRDGQRVDELIFGLLRRE
jgi:[ribosomal protein S5]-alanine N-acetyltransferase